VRVEPQSANGDTARHAPCLRAVDGRVLPAPAASWFEPVTPAEARLLERVDGPVLDIGCGPARHALALAESGVVCLGIDISPAALAVARARGAPVLQRSIFDRVPGHGRWGTALLLDGNVGIGGTPALLLRRVAALLRDRGRVLMEVGAPGVTPARDTVRFEHDGTAGPWFAWAGVGVDALDGLARASGMRIHDTWADSARWFAQLDK
jgi:SAM-dependent methyltransferase